MSQPSTATSATAHSVWPDWNTAAQAVIETGRQAAQRGWVPATAGNFSVRAADGLVAITRSGVDKGAMVLTDILRQPAGQALLPGSSAEAELHLRLYADHPTLGAVFHTHNLAASVLGRLHVAHGRIVLEGWELQKALQGIRTHETRVHLPVFANTQDIAALANEVSAHFALAPADTVLAPGYVIAGHGLYAWGSDARQAWRHLEALDVLLAQVLALRA
ncbi:methylthioribulose 1-phosphate dehydratase [Rhodoferax saidenbachensis]|uniref:Methylthioribulose-1-phosphate dehydratase n=1 Tax=Rhodoferax saidenbachensis TaxID=1484693 RepID=A0ABU1ZRC0_9BURK|nr:methylthioribulose 1-phosphate dehydratase [Rhodoferax saidenbachensis]MDR7307420.1 methylthioribulose-1-phosphate dehydratase [Rhodoferax saidenbachensis]